ncbi:MAG: hypothetical protein LBV38_05945 [Alistipes sp.]|jgi:hypothetical protein|nr:hypothetical protein [Alistipes sp.]
MKFANIIKMTLLAVILTASATSCIRDNDIFNRTPVTEDDIETVNLSIDIPSIGEEGAVTRALTESGELDVAAVDVLQFTEAGKFAYRSTGYGIGGSGNTRTFSARLLKGTFDVVIIANGRTQVNDAMNGTGGVTQIDENTAIQTALDRIAVTLAATDKITGNVIPALPMFGIVEDAVVDTGNDIEALLIRALAKVNVVLSPAVISAGKFKIADVRLYNQSLKGWIAPQLSSWPTDNISTTAWYGGTSTPPRASYTAAVNPDQPIVYSGSADNVTDHSVLRSIYTFEAPVGSESGRDTNVCLVIGGYYDGSTTPSYYRVDFNNTGTYMPLLRNHEYNVRINSVTVSGYPNPDDAFHGTPLLETEIADWSIMPENTIIDGQYFLTVDRDLVTIKGSGKGVVELEAATNYDLDDRGFPEGLQFDETEIVFVSGGDNWLTVDDVLGANGSFNRTIGFTADANKTGAAREAEIKLHAGNITKVITVWQLAMGVFAAPGVIGYTEDTHELTLRGSVDFTGEADLEATAKKIHPDGLHPQTVYVAYFKPGSLIATDSENIGKPFTSQDIIAAPSKADGHIGLEALRSTITGSGAAAWTHSGMATNAGTVAAGETFPNSAYTWAQGLGDPCDYYFSDSGQQWITPTLAMNKAELDGAIVIVSEWTNATAYSPVWARKATRVVPATGYRDALTGMIDGMNGKSGSYWLSTAASIPGGLNAYEFYFANPTYGQPRSQSVNGHYGYPVRCVEKPQPLIHAAPGVVGIRHDDYMALKKGTKQLGDPSIKLTLAGSNIYNGTAASNATTTKEFGTLNNEPVYTVYFKWGSTVATIGGVNNDSFSADDVVWVNPGFTGSITGNYDSFSAATYSGLRTDYAIDTDPTKGWGDICTTFNEDEKKFRTPTGVPSWNKMSNGSITYKTDIKTNDVDYVSAGGMSTDGTMFLPVAGLRDGDNGSVQYIGDDTVITQLGSYWASSMESATSANQIHIEKYGVAFSNISIGTNSALPIRCMPIPPPDPRFIPAPPGVIGIRQSDYDWLMTQRKSKGAGWIPKTSADGRFDLTLRGSSTYDGLTQFTNAMTDAKYGPLEQEPVYTVYYMWGSLVAMIGGVDPVTNIGDEWSTDGSDVVWVNPEFTGATNVAWATAKTWAGLPNNNIWNLNKEGNDVASAPTKGHGDPCAYMGAGWRMPTRRDWHIFGGGDPSSSIRPVIQFGSTYGNYTFTTAHWMDEVPVPAYGTFTQSPEGPTTSLPAMGLRSGDSEMRGQNFNVSYQSSTNFNNGASGSYNDYVGIFTLTCSPSGGEVDSFVYRDEALPVRCFENFMVTPLSLEFEGTANTLAEAKSVTITADDTWSVTDQSPWLAVDVTSGTGNATVKVYPTTANNTGALREDGFVEFTSSAGAKKRVAVSQKPVPPPDPRFVLAPPGVVGIKATDYLRLVAARVTQGNSYFDPTIKLTLQGSSTYGDPSNPSHAMRFVTDQEFGPLEDEPVYVLYFQSLKLIGAIGGTLGDPWSTDDAVYVNPEYTGTRNFSTNIGLSDNTAWATDLTKGFGDICATMPGSWQGPKNLRADANVTSFAYTSPAKKYSGTHTPFGYGTGYVQWGTNGMVMSWDTSIKAGAAQTGALSRDQDLYLPVTGYRDGQMRHTQVGYYMGSSGANYGVSFRNDLNVVEADANGIPWAPVRCVPK